MVNVSRKMFLTALMGSVTAISARASTEDSSALDAYMNAWVKAEQFSGTVLVAHDGKPILNKGYGMANCELGVKNSRDTVYQIASLTKAFTAAAVLLLQERGKLDIGKPISAYLDNCPETWQAITVRHLLTHTSGIPNYTNLPDNLDKVGLRQTDAEIIARVINLPLEFSPGTQFHYCNSGYHLLGMIIARVAGKSFADYLQENIFIPLGMTHSSLGSNKRILPNRAAGYIVEDGVLVNARYCELAPLHAEGGICSTTGDMLLWDQALYTDKLLSRQSREAMFTPFQGTYGYGWNITKLFDHREMRHSGLNLGFASHIKRFPDDKITVLVLSNNQSVDAEKIATDLTAIVFGQPYNRPRVARVFSPEILQRYVGAYESGPDMTITVTLDGGRLFGQGTGSGKSELFALAENRFFLKNSGSEITFEHDKHGVVTAIILTKGDQKTTVRRISPRGSPEH